MNLELVLNLSIVGGITGYSVWCLRDERTSYLESAFLIVGGSFLIIASVLFMMFLKKLLPHESIFDVLLLKRFQLAPGGGVLFGYACILVGIWRGMDVYNAMKIRKTKSQIHQSN